MTIGRTSANCPAAALTLEIDQREPGDAAQDAIVVLRALGILAEE